MTNCTTCLGLGCGECCQTGIGEPRHERILTRLGWLLILVAALWFGGHVAIANFENSRNEELAQFANIEKLKPDKDLFKDLSDGLANSTIPVLADFGR